MPDQMILNKTRILSMVDWILGEREDIYVVTCADFLQFKTQLTCDSLVLGDFKLGLSFTI